MKRTTYIFIGVFLLNILLAVSLMVYLKVTSDLYPDWNHTVVFDREQKDSLDLDGVHTVEFVVKGIDAEEFFVGDPLKVKITESRNPGKGKVSYPSSKCLKVSKENGVLSVVVDLTSEIPEVSKSQLRGRFRRIYLRNLMVDIETGKALKWISSQRKGIVVTVQHVRLDNLHLAEGSITMDSCEIRSLAVAGDVGFLAKASSFDDLRIDLDRAHWEFQNSNVKHTLYLAGSNHHQLHLPEDQYPRLVWEPKNDKAQLSVILKRKAEVLKQ